MNLQEIKKAIEEGKKVFWSNTCYRVIKGANGEYLISHEDGHSIGLTWTDGATLNGKEQDFFTDQKTTTC